MALFSSTAAAGAYNASSLPYSAHPMRDRISFQTLPAGTPAAATRFDTYLRGLYNQSLLKGALLRGLEKSVNDATQLMAGYASLTTAEKGVLSELVNGITWYTAFPMTAHEEFDHNSWESNFTEINAIRQDFNTLGHDDVEALEQSGYAQYLRQNPQEPKVSPADWFKTRHAYELYVTLHHRFVDETFGSTNQPAPFQLKYYLLAQAETPFKGYWLHRRSAIPFWIGNISPSGGFKKVYIQFLGLSATTKIFAPTHSEFYNRNFGFNNYPRATSVAGTELRVKAWQETHQLVDVVDTDVTPIQRPKKGTRVLQPKELATFSVIPTNEGYFILGADHPQRFLYSGGSWNAQGYYSGGDKIKFDYEANETFRNSKLGYDSGSNRNKLLKVGLPLQNVRVQVVTPNAGSLADMIGYPILSDADGRYYIHMPQSPGATVTADIDRNGASGLTLGWGFDLYNIGTPTKTYENDDHSYGTTLQDKIDRFLLNATTMGNWSATDRTATLDAIHQMYSGGGRTLSGTAANWLKNRPKFDRLDMNEGAALSFKTMIVEGIKVGTHTHFNIVEKRINEELKKLGVKSPGNYMNQVEWFVVNAAYWNGPGSLSGLWKEFAAAIKVHSYDKLLAVARKLPDIPNRPRILGLLTSNREGLFEGADKFATGNINGVQGTFPAVQAFWQLLNMLK